jgi:hypothetical protein
MAARLFALIFISTMLVVTMNSTDQSVGCALRLSLEAGAVLLGVVFCRGFERDVAEMSQTCAILQFAKSFGH